MPVFTSIAALGAGVGGAIGLAGPLTFGTSLALGAGTAALGGLGAVKAFKALTPDSPDYPNPVQQQQGITKPSESASEAAAKQKVDKKRKSIARNKSIYTNPLGLTPADKSDLSLKTLTGA